MRACLRACVRACVYSCNHHEDKMLFIKLNRDKSVQGDVTQAAQFMEECGEGGGGLEREEENSIRWRNGIYQQKHMSHVQYKLAVSANCACYCC